MQVIFDTEHRTVRLECLEVGLSSKRGEIDLFKGPSVRCNPTYTVEIHESYQYDGGNLDERIELTLFNKDSDRPIDLRPFQYEEK